MQVQQPHPGPAEHADHQRQHHCHPLFSRVGAAGGVESVICALAIRDGVLPPTMNYTTPDPACDLDYVPNQARKAKIRACLNNSLGFGGHNATLCFKAVE